MRWFANRCRRRSPICYASSIELPVTTPRSELQGVRNLPLPIKVVAIIAIALLPLGVAAALMSVRDYQYRTATIRSQG